MQPFQCNLQPEIQEPHRTTHTDTTTRCKTHRRNRLNSKRPQTATAAQTRYLSSPAAATLHGKTQGFVLRLPPQNIAHATFMQPLQCDLQPPFIKVKSQSHTTLQGQVSIRSASTLHQGHVKSHTTLQGQLSIAHHPSRSSLNRTPPFKIKSQSRSTLQGQVSIRSATTLHQGHVKSHTTLQGQLSIAHHPSRSSLNRTPPFKIKSQSHTTLQGQVSIAHHPSHHPSRSIAHHPSRSSLNRAAPLQGQVSIRSATTLHQGQVKSHTTLQGQLSIVHHPSRSSLNRTPPFKIKSQSHTTLQGQVSIAHHPSHHPSRSSVNRAPPFLNRAPPFKVKSQSHTTLQGQVSIAHHPSSFQDSEFYLSVPRSIASQLPLINKSVGLWKGISYTINELIMVTFKINLGL